MIPPERTETGAHQGTQSARSPSQAVKPRMTNLLEVRDLGVSLRRKGSDLQLTRGLNFDVAPGERIGIVGESGCGKSITGLALLGLLPKRSMRVAGEIRLAGRDIADLRDAEWRQVRGRRIAMIFQEPMSALDPVFTVGHQIGEAIRIHFKVGGREARERAIDVLERVGIPAPAQRHDEYPHQLSGGMRQRAMIAIALACEPELLVADEPTTALDVTIQAQIVDLMVQLSEQSGTALLFITHDIGVVAESCQRLLTMYAGEIVEEGPIDEALRRPRHPYTSGLMQSLPSLSQRKTVLPSIPGRVPTPDLMPRGCRFAPRCGFRTDGCEEEQQLRSVAGAPAQRARCQLAEQLHLKGTV